MKIITGKHRGRNLEAPNVKSTRPTSNKNREKIFNIINSNFPEYLHNQEIIDICAGSGAFGLEALSQGAKRATFVDINNEAIHCIHSNVELCNETLNSKVIKKDSRFIKINKETKLIFLDPPYAKTKLLKQIIDNIKDQSLENCLIIIETNNDNIFTELPIAKSSSAGSTAIYFSII